MSKTFDFNALISDAANTEKLPPLHLWQPKLSGDIDIKIDSQGRWSHEGVFFARLEIPKLFSRILVREGDDYFLKTPVEKWRISVVDVPFTVVGLQQSDSAQGSCLTFVSSTEDVITLDEQHPLRIEIDPHTQEPSPYIMVRQGMEAKLNRNVFYQLVALAELDEAQQQLQVYSAGQCFVLGAC